MSEKRKKTMIKIGMFVVCFLVFTFCSVKVRAENKVKRHIHIVFDNSVSMVADEQNNPRTDLAKATYALQVLLGMLDEEDTAVIYPVSKYQSKWEEGMSINTTCSSNGNVIRITGATIEEKGETQSVVEKSIGEVQADYTYFHTVITALEELHNEESTAEKWLVVFSDGLYEDWKEEIGEEDKAITKGVSKTFNNEKYEDINIIHYSFRKDIFYKELNTDKGKNITYYPENKSLDSETEMLNIMIQIGNQIFNRERVDTVGTDGKYTFEIEVPARKLIVFTQRKKENNNAEVEIEIKDEDTGKKIKVNSTKNIKVKTLELEEKLKNKRGKTLTYKPGTLYEGNIIYYENFTQNNLLEKGKYVLETMGGDIDTLEVYYEPDVAMGLVAYNLETGEEYPISAEENEKKIPSGEYNIKLELFDPLDDSVLPADSSIRNEIEHMLRITDKEENILGDEVTDSWQGILEPGEYSVTGAIEIFPGSNKNMEIPVIVVDSLKNITAELMIPDGGINMEEFGQQGNSILLKVYNDGILLDSEYKENIQIEQIDKSKSFYNYKIEETAEGWLLWPQKNMGNFGLDDEAGGEKEIKLQVSLKMNGIEMEPILLKETVMYHGNPFVVNFRTSWREEIGLIDYFRGTLFNGILFGGLYIEPTIDGEKVDWEIIESKQLQAMLIGNNQELFQIQQNDKKGRWKIIPQVKIRDFLLEEEKREITSDIMVSAELKRYGQEEKNEKVVELKMDISMVGIILIFIILILAIYGTGNVVWKKIHGISVGKIRGYIQFSRELDIDISVKIKQSVIYNFLVPGKCSFSVYLNEIKDGKNKKIRFVSRNGGLCTITNVRQCLAFSEIAINGTKIQENEFYDLCNEMRIVVEHDSDKTIIIRKR